MANILMSPELQTAFVGVLSAAGSAIVAVVTAWAFTIRNRSKMEASNETHRQKVEDWANQRITILHDQLMKSMQDRIDASNMKIKAQTDEIERLKATMKTEAEFADRREKSLKDRIDALERQVDRLSNDLKAERDNVAKLTQEKEDLVNQNARLVNDNAHLIQQLQQKVDKIETWQQKREASDDDAEKKSA